MPNVVVRMQTMDGTWEVGGADRRTGIVPEHVKYGADLNGSSTASFDLRRDPGAFWPDISAFTPVEIEIDGLLVWSGRVKETPTRETAQESVINVQCEGWQFHLDDDVYQKDYVHTSLGDWKDTRSFAGTSLTVMPTSGVSTLDSNGIGQWTLGFPNGASWPSGAGSGITLDLGPAGDIPKRIVITAYRTAGAPSVVQLYGRTTTVVDNPIGGTGIVGADAISALPLNTSFSSTPVTVAGTFSGGARYVHLFLYNFSSAYTVAATDGNGDVLIITSIQVFTSTAYESGNTSILPASTVVADTLGLTPLLAQDTTQVTTTSFAIPDFGVREPQTAREVQDAVNSFHNYNRKVDVNKRLVFKPKPSVAVLAAGDSSNIEIEDASANSGDEIYNRVYVTATGPDGTPLIVTVAASQISSLVRGISSPAPTNPSGDVNATGWSSTFGAVTRSTSVFDSAPGSILSPVVGGGNMSMVGTFTGTFRRGTTYLLTFAAWKNGSGGVNLTFGDTAAGDTTFTFAAPIGWNASTWQQFSLTWTPRVDTSAVTLTLEQHGGGAGRSTQIGVDTLVLSQGVPTIPDRRGFLRTKHLPLSFPATQATMTQIGSIYLADHLRTPFKGSVTAHGSGAITGLTSGDPTPIWTLPTFTGEMLRLNNRIDPDTGGIGRDGRMAQVDVDVDTASATIALDATRQNFESFLSRLALVTGTKLGG